VSDRSLPGTPRLRRIGGIVAVAVVLVLVPFYASAAWLRVGEYAMVGAVAAIGLTMLTGHAGQLSLGTPFFMLVGGTTYCVLGGPLEEGSSLVSWGLPSFVSLIGAIVVSALAGLAFAPVSARVGGIYLAMASLSLVYLGLFLGQRLESLTGGTSSGRQPEPLKVFGFSLTSGDPPWTFAGVPMGPPERTWFVFAVLTAIAYALARGAVVSRPGRAWRAVRDNPSSAAAMGVDVRRVRAGVFAISSAYAGLAGVMLVLWFGLLKPDENEFIGSWSITTAIALLAMILIGGLGSITGAVVGAALVFGMPLVLQILIPRSSFLSDLMGGDAGFTPVVVTAFVYGVSIILVVLFEPGGLATLGRRLIRADRPT
jgi:branched-chain amino acid transport system permease protein